MSQSAVGNLKGLAPSERRAVEKLFQRSVPKDEIVSLDLARELLSLAEQLSRRIGVLVNRQGHIVEVVLGTKEIIYLPDLGRYRLGEGRLRSLRLLFTDLSPKHTEPVIPYDIYGDLEKLRLDLVAAIRPGKNRILMRYAHLIPTQEEIGASVQTELVDDLGRLEFDFTDLIQNLEIELAAERKALVKRDGLGAILVGVYEPGGRDPESSMAELKELARTAGVTVVDTLVQKRRIDPRTFMGTGKLEEVVLRAIRQSAEMLVFDAELKPSQWRAVTNATELKIIDRSMLILDIFAQRAKSGDG